jgi:septum formation protein
MSEIILASASPSRKRLLESIGIHPTIIVSGVNEELPEITTLPPAEMVIALAIMKAQTVAQGLKEKGRDAIVIGCDSTFEFDGQNLGKPETAANAAARAKAMRGSAGLLHTGHCIISTSKNLEFSDLSTSLVHFAQLSDSEIEAYVATGEPLQVAGGFTLDGFSAPFIDRIDGDPSGIIGLSLSTLRKGIIALGYNWEDIGLVNK